MSTTNEMKLIFDSIAENESFARVTVGAFFTQLDPLLEEVCDVKTAVSEAVTNAIIHGYNQEVHKIEVYAIIEFDKKCIRIEVTDFGCGIADIEQAMEPLFTTKSELERSGMGFAFMEAFMDEIKVESEIGKGTKITMWKKVREAGEIKEEWTKQSL